MRQVSEDRYSAIPPRVSMRIEEAYVRFSAVKPVKPWKKSKLPKRRATGK